MTKYYYAKQNLFGTEWVECSVEMYDALTMGGISTKFVLSDDEYSASISDTPLKDALLDELRDSAPAIVSILADELIDEEDLQEAFSATPEEVQYFIDEELINPDYDELEFEDAEEATDDGVIGAPVADSSTNIKRWFPNAAITISAGLKASADEIKKVAQAIYTLMEGGMQYDSDELDGGKFVKRLETSRDVTTQVNKKTRANPSILFLPDFSPSCSSYASLYNTFLQGVTNIRDDFNVVSAPQYNGVPKWYIINGKRAAKETQLMAGDSLWEDDDGDLRGNVYTLKDAQQDFYFKQIAKVVADNNITTVVIAGDMDGVWCYTRLLLCEHVERVIWVDGSYWNSDETKITNRTAELCYRLFMKNAERQIAKSKLSYWSGVKTVKDFVRVFERSNSW
jgi:hypothetical protein